MYQVVKRDGALADFAISKISAAITKAFDAIGKPYHSSVIDMIALRVTADFGEKIHDDRITVEGKSGSVSLESGRPVISKDKNL